MINVLANRVMEFTNDSGETVKTEIGFCQLPEWVEKHDYFKLGIIGGELKTFESSSDASTESVLKEQEKVNALQEEAKALEEKIATSTKASEKKLKDLNKEIEALEKKKNELSGTPPVDPPRETK